MEARLLGDGPGTRVTVEVDWNVVEPSLEANFLEQVESADGREDLLAWRSGALHGARHALDTANALPCGLRITEIYGELDNTNPTIVAAACAHAVWEAIGYAPSMDERQRLDQEVARSMTRPPAELPTLMVLATSRNRTMLNPLRSGSSSVRRSLTSAKLLL